MQKIAKGPEGVLTALVQNNTVNENGYLADKNTFIVIGTDIVRIEEWQCVYKGFNLEWSALKWFGRELFAADQNCVYRIKNITDFTNSCEK